MPARMIFLEFNELCPDLMREFIAAGQLPNFRRLFQESEVFTTDAQEQGELLNPWVQWITVHTGLAAAEHGITTLSEGHRLQAKAIWDVLSDHGYRVWVCGSMNPRYDAPLNGCLVPDPWSTGAQSYPAAEFDGFLNFVRTAVQEHTNSEASGGSAKTFLKYMLQHGLSARTIAAAGWQLCRERMTNARWRRAVLLDRFQWDLFVHYYRRLRPQFATFFSNSTAHFQHCFWRDMQPEKFQAGGTGQGGQYKDAILYGYQQMDGLVKRCLRLADAQTTIVFCSALSQQPYLDFEIAGGRHYYRLRDAQTLYEMFGLSSTTVYEPVMAEQFNLRFPTAHDAEVAARQLETFRLGDKPVFHLTPKEHALLVQCQITREVARSEQISVAGKSPLFSFYDVFYQLETLKSGRHHPDGMFWIRHPDRRHQVHSGKVALTSIAPWVLEQFQVPLASGMAGPALVEGPASLPSPVGSLS